ncbi:MAG: hypothetical protein VX000_04835, partial [Myxococcota bacterium]|nr:hypothetical protein [Myxococcota bacterium]
MFEREVELDELDPGATDTLSFNVFASRQCAGKTARVRVRGHDTQRFPDGMTYDVNLKLGALDSGKLVLGDLDGDDYGHSEDDPTAVPRLVAGGQVELSAGLRVSGSGVSQVHQTFMVPSPLRSSHEPGWAAFRLGGGVSVASPVDDVDLTVPDEASWQAGLEGHAQRLGWNSPSDAVLFVAVDSVIETGRPGARSSSTAGGSVGQAATAVVDRRKVEAVL